MLVGALPAWCPNGIFGKRNQIEKFNVLYTAVAGMNDKSVNRTK